MPDVFSSTFTQVFPVLSKVLHWIVCNRDAKVYAVDKNVNKTRATNKQDSNDNIDSDEINQIVIDNNDNNGDDIDNYARIDATDKNEKISGKLLMSYCSHNNDKWCTTQQKTNHLVDDFVNNNID